MNNKWFVVLMLPAILFIPSAVFGMPISVSSYTYNISLQFDSAEHISSTGHYDYDYEGVDGLGQSISHAIVVPDYYGSTQKPVVTAEVSPFSLYLKGDNLEMDVCYASISSWWDFTSDYDKINLDVDGYLSAWLGGSGGWSKISYRLADITDKNVLAEGSRNVSTNNMEAGEFGVEAWLDDTYEFSMLKDRKYRFGLYAETLSWDNTNARIGANFSLSDSSIPFDVPEPSTIVFLGFMLSWLCWCKMKLVLN